MYADDTTLFCNIDNNVTEDVINRELFKIYEWLGANKLTLNVSKTEPICKNLRLLKLTDMFSIAVWKFYYKLMSNQLPTYFTGWRPELPRVCARYEIRSPVSHLPVITHKFAEHSLRYCLINGNASAVHLEPIIKIRKKAIKTITFSSYLSPSEHIFQSLNILYFRKLVIQRVSLLMFKISKCDVLKPLYALFRINNSYHNYQTRRSESIHVPICRTEAIYKTFSYFGAHIMIWNHISNNISTNVSYSFLKHIVKFYI